MNIARPHTFRLIAPFALAYFFSYGLRTINSAIAPKLISELGLSEASLGLMTAAYFLSFALAQLPIGLAIDRFGPRRVNAGLLVFAVMGCICFAMGRSKTSLLIARSLIGLGVSGALMTAIKSNAQWFVLDRLPAMNAWVHVWGLIGAVVSTLPVAWLVRTAGISGVFFAAALVGTGASVALWLVARDKPHVGQHETLAQNLLGTARVFGARHFWTLAIVASLALGSHMAMQGLWVGQWLRHARMLSESAAGDALFTMMLAGACGALVWGQLASAMAARGVAPLTVYGVACGLNVLILVLMATQPDLPANVLAAAYTFTGMGGSLCYAVLTARFPIALTGRANTSLNLLIFVVAFSVQAGAGFALNGLQQRGFSTPSAYSSLLLGLAAVMTMALIWALVDKPREAIAP